MDATPSARHAREVVASHLQHYAFNIGRVVTSGDANNAERRHMLGRESAWVIVPEKRNNSNSILRITWIEFWTFYATALVVFAGFYVPFDLVLLKEIGVKRLQVELFLDVCWTMDIVIHFFTAYPNHPQGHMTDLWETNLAKIAGRYLSGLFIFDLITVLPGWLMLGSLVFTGDALSFSTAMGHSDLIMRMCRFVRLFRLKRFRRLLERLQSHCGFSYSTLAFAETLLVTVFMCHWMACTWVAIEGKVTTGAVISFYTDGPTWLSALIEVKGDPCFPDAHNAPICVYALSLYWSVVTFVTVGYGDLAPQNLAEYCLCTVTILFSGYVWAYVVGSVVHYLSNLDPDASHWKQKMDDLNNLMENMQLPAELRVRLREYMHESKRTHRAKNQQAMLEANMSEGLQMEVAKVANDELLRCIYWARELHEEVRFEICRALRPHFFGPGEELRKRQCIVVIRTGIAAARGLILVRGDVWGHENILLQSEYLEDTLYLRSLTFLEVLMLSQAEFRDIIVKFPKDDKRLRRVQVRLAVYRAFVLAAYLKKMNKDFSSQRPQAQTSFSGSFGTLSTIAKYGISTASTQEFS